MSHKGRKLEVFFGILQAICIGRGTSKINFTKNNPQILGILVKHVSFDVVFAMLDAQGCCWNSLFIGSIMVVHKLRRMEDDAETTT